MLTRLHASLRVILVITALVATGELVAPATAAHAQDNPAPTGTWLAGTGPGNFTFTLRSPGTVLVTLGDLTADLRLSVHAGSREVAASDRPGTTFEEVQVRLPAGRNVAEVSAGHSPVPADARFRLLIRPVDERLQVLDAHPVTGGGLYAITGQLLNNSRGWRSYPRVTAQFRRARRAATRPSDRARRPEQAGARRARPLPARRRPACRHRAVHARGQRPTGDGPARARR